jgi:hypothetical protein
MTFTFNGPIFDDREAWRAAVARQLRAAVERPRAPAQASALPTDDPYIVEVDLGTFLALKGARR